MVLHLAGWGWWADSKVCLNMPLWQKTGERGVGGLLDRSGEISWKANSLFKNLLSCFNMLSTSPHFLKSLKVQIVCISLSWLALLWWLRSLDIDSKAKSFWSDLRACGVVCQRTSHYHRLAPRKTRQRLFAPPKTCQRHSGQRGYYRIWVTTKDDIRTICQ